MAASRGTQNSRDTSFGDTGDKMGDSVDRYCHAVHDKFNLFVLPIISFLSVSYFFNKDYYYNTLFYTFLCYILADTIWLVTYPRTVASPGIILLHHIMVILVWPCGYFAEDVRDYTCTGRFMH